MLRNSIRASVGVLVCVFGLAAIAAAQTSTTSTRVRKFEVVAVDGNKVVVKGQDGTKEYTVPDDFRFDVDGKQLSVHELKPGMKGTATVTTTTTVTPVHITEVRNGTVMQVSGPTIIVRGPQGIKMFSEGDVAKRGVKIYKDGQPVQLSDLHQGDKLSATIITEGTPKVVTERQVQASLAHPESMGAAPSAPAMAPASSSAAMAPAMAPKHLPKTGSEWPLVGLLGLASLAAGAGIRTIRQRAA